MEVMQDLASDFDELKLLCPNLAQHSAMNRVIHCDYFIFTSLLAVYVGIHILNVIMFQ